MFKYVLLFALFFFIGGTAEARVTVAPRALVASWYGGHQFENKLMANGHRFHESDPSIAASLEYAMGTKLRVRNHLAKNPRCETTIVIQDHGPYVHGRDVDASYAAAKELCFVDEGIAWLDIIVVPHRIGLEGLPVFWREIMLRPVPNNNCLLKGPLTRITCLGR